MAARSRLIPLQSVKNARDLSTVSNNTPLLPGRLYRMGKMSDMSTPLDKNVLFDENSCGIRTILDLRSPTEYFDDENLHRKDAFEEFHTILWKEGRRKMGELDQINHLGRNTDVRTALRGSDDGEERTRTEFDDKAPHPDEHDETSIASQRTIDSQEGIRKERHFIPVMNEFKYIRGTLSKLGKRDLAKILVKSPAAVVSRRARTNVRDTVLGEVNNGGLPLMNELILRKGGNGIRYALIVISDRERHPVAFHCTAGKDRTGILAAIILALLQVPHDEIAEDYGLSRTVYKEMDDGKRAMVGALHQNNLNPDIFLDAPPPVMLETLEFMEKNYVGVVGYLDSIGFGPALREKLVSALTE